MKFSLKLDPSLRPQVEQMSVAQLLKIVTCPQQSADDLTLTPGYRSLYLHYTTPAQAKTFIDSYTQGNPEQLFVCADTEFGAGEQLEGLTQFPSMYALGVANDESLAYAAGRIAAREMRENGYRWSFSPCVDILLHDESPMASNRCAGRDAETVIRIAGANMRGMQDGGVIATLKHFPGEGFSFYDQHISTTENPLSWEEWNSTYGRVYRELIEQGAKTIMPAHIALPCYDTPDPVMGLCPPATLSKRLMVDLLRGELGFEGIVCSDAVTMSGFSGFMNYYKACATFLKHGGDLIVFGRTDEAYVEKMTELVASDFLPLSVLQDRAWRILSFYQQMNAELKPIDDTVYDAAAVTEQIVRKSVQVVRDRFGVLPFHATPETKLLLVDLSNNYQHRTDAEDFLQALRAEGFQVDTVVDPGSRQLAKLAESGSYDLIICTNTNGFGFGTNVLKLHGLPARSMMDGWTKLGTPVVFVVFQHPFFHTYFPATADTVINTNGVATATNRVVLELLFGKA